MKSKMGKPIKVVTKTGLVLTGRLFKSKAAAKTVLIALTGVEGNINNNRFFINIGNSLNKVGIDMIVAHTRDAFNYVNTLNAKTGKYETYGARNENFSDSDDDVEAYLKYANSQGYEHIILGGQSFGANKVIHYLAYHSEIKVEHFILLSPVNVDSLRKRIPAKQRDYITMQIRIGDGDKILPFKLFKWLKSTALNASRWLYDDTLNNMHSEINGDFSQVERVGISGMLLIGTYDGYAGGDPQKYLLNINSHFETKKQNKVIFIDKGRHVYYEKEQEVANQVVKTMVDWRLA